MNKMLELKKECFHFCFGEVSVFPRDDRYLHMTSEHDTTVNSENISYLDNKSQPQI